MDSIEMKANSLSKVKKIGVSKKKMKPTSWLVLVLSLLLGFGAIYYYVLPSNPKPTGSGDLNNQADISQTTQIEYQKFDTEEQMREYLAKAQDESGISGVFSRFEVGRDMVMMETFEAPNAMVTQGSKAQAEPSRVSGTNIQVEGVDEPDVVKTNGQEIYFSSNLFFRGVPEPILMDERSAPGSIMPQVPRAGVKVVDAYPPESLNELGRINEQGELLLDNDNLIVISGNRLSGYKVSDPSNPQSNWMMKLDDNVYVVSSRLYKGDVYVVARNFVRRNFVCPMPLVVGGISVPCTDVWRPTVNVPVDSTFTVMKINPEDGQVLERISFVGSSDSSLVYMNQQHLYLTHTHYPNTIPLIVKFFSEDGWDLIDKDSLNKLSRLNDLEISDRAKMVELQTIIERYYSGLDDDERLRVENEFNDRIEKFLEMYGRDLERTVVVKVATDNLEILTQGEVAGSPLNQFSLDEYEGNLRIATTTSGRLWGSGSSVNDVYVLNENMGLVGEALGMGLDERIYSVRFVGDRGYVVTFKEIDPFYVLDLTDPTNPEIKGELKIPGYSSYLHPLSDSVILGVGREGGQVKLTTFDVSMAENPKEIDTYVLNEYWSETINNHHAFLHDSEFGVFFVPGGQGGYVFSYKNGQLRLEKAIRETGVKRALFIDEYFYVVAETEISVYDENDWSSVNKLELE